MVVPIAYYLVLSAILFSIGVGAFLIKRNIITVFMSIELMLNAVNLTFVAFAYQWHQFSGSDLRLLRDGRRRRRSRGRPGHHHRRLPHQEHPQRRSSRPDETMNGNPSLHLWLIPLLPFAGFLLNGLLGRQAVATRSSRPSPCSSTAPRSCWSSAIALRFSGLTLPYTETMLCPGLQAGHRLPRRLRLPLDQLTLIMLLVVTGVGFLIHIYSVGYMAHEEGYWRFFAYLNLFMFFMLTLVLAESFLLMFVGWEGVGLASYLLIGFYFTRTSAANAGKKAFILNRIGDFGFLLAMFLMIAHFGSLSFNEVFAADRPASGTARRLPHRHRVAAGPRRDRQVGADSALCLAARRHGRPHAGLRPHPRRHHGHRRRLHDRALPRDLRPLAALLSWSPSSAQPRRCSPPPSAWCRRTSSGCLPTPPSRSSATCSWPAESPPTPPLSSTWSPTPSSKALLFLAAGSVIHALGGEQDMRAMGGLRKKIPITFWTMTAGVFAISGMPPFAGFFSKDEILYQAILSPGRGPILWFVGLVLTALPDRLLHVPALVPDLLRRTPDRRRVRTTPTFRCPECTSSHGIHDSGGRCSSRSRCSPFSPSSADGSAGRTSFGGSNHFEHFLEPVVSAADDYAGPRSKQRP
jgi:hypothetical protein